MSSLDPNPTFNAYAHADRAATDPAYLRCARGVSSLEPNPTFDAYARAERAAAGQYPTFDA